jgi:hypothetical protein
VRGGDKRKTKAGVDWRDVQSEGRFEELNSRLMSMVGVLADRVCTILRYWASREES